MVTALYHHGGSQPQENSVSVFKLELLAKTYPTMEEVNSTAKVTVTAIYSC